MSEGGMYILIPSLISSAEHRRLHSRCCQAYQDTTRSSKQEAHSPTWQNPPHPTVSNAQSETLAQEADVIVFGSGITGIGAAHYLPHSASPLKVTMLEARTAVSGATGRNGGHLVSDSDALFPALVKAVGAERVIETREAAEYREVVSATMFTDQATFKDAVQSLRDFLKAVPEGDIRYKVFNKEEATRMFNFTNTAGATAKTGVAALWPYRLLTALLASLRKDFPDQGNSYIVHTTRGPIRTKDVIHCTNGYSAHSITGLVGSLYPLRGTMSTQKLGPDFTHAGDKMSWSQESHGTYNGKTGLVHLGLYYAQQNAKTGVMFLGGKSQNLRTLLSSDDSSVGDDARATLTSAAPKIWKDAAPTKPVDVWSEII
ncbi:uncharacterized protein FIESC28_00809 [Fusarium coffeatum]|uniref:FAD dependent oxidoreductase domain-containing protein n=1 Tax=Fusarium coffeatum TaxID=231269 RepID=A0A366SAP6_9HYPO|nr:uncharacterized protein FIESC28_00809 [Fusarium coffeatum]RBR26404.1 hypothetical protein FIESC28_00809 [Fusarium coffeatum]